VADVNTDLRGVLAHHVSYQIVGMLVPRIRYPLYLKFISVNGTAPITITECATYADKNKVDNGIFDTPVKT
jgi:hypothetical protein